MRKVSDKEITGYRGSHTVFRHGYESQANYLQAQFAVRRVDVGKPNEETQIETQVSRAGKKRTSTHHMSICMTPAEAREFALAIAPELAPKPASRIGGSILPSSEPRILQPMHGVHGALQVRALPELDTHGLFLDGRMIASHPNGYSCHALAELIVAAWSNKERVGKALDQFDYILRCGGMGVSSDSLQAIVTGRAFQEA